MKASESHGQVTIWKNSVFILFSQIIRLITILVITIGIARLYGPVAFGQFSIAFTIANICLVIADFGFDVLLTTEISKNRYNANLLARKYFSVKIIFTMISILIMASIPFFQALSAESKSLVYTLTFYVVFSTFTNFFYALFRGFEKFEYETGISFISNLALLVFLVIFGFMKTPLVQLMLFFIAARFIGLVLSIYRSNSLVGAGVVRIDFSGWKEIINKILVFGTHFIFGNLFFQLDTILLGIWKGDQAAGIYRSAFNLMILVLLIPDIIIGTFLPVLSRLFIDNIERWKSVSRLLYKLLLFVSLPIALIFFFSAEQIVSFFYGTKYFGDAVPLLKIFSLIVVIRFVGEPYALMMTTSKRQHVRMIIVMIATFLSIMLNYLVIPVYGINGAAFVALGVNLLVAAGYILAGKKESLSWLAETRVLIVLAAVLSLTILLLLYSHLIVLFIYIAAYSFTAYFVGFSGEERKLILKEFAINKS